MKKFTLFLSSIVILATTITTSVIAQTLPIPADQQIVIIDETAGNLEYVINNDVIDGKRVNPNRIYMLKAGLIYIQEGPINFGGNNDTAAVLNIIGEAGGAKPMIIMNPGADGGAFSNVIMGSITLENLYWGGTNWNGESTTIFSVRSSNQRIVVDGLVVENMFGGGVFGLSGATGELDVFIKNSYFRDNSQMANSWNHSILVRGDDGQAYDSVWIENTTVNWSSMPFFGKQNPVNFMFFNHNLCMNGAKYPIWYERYKEAYITNNMFINSNFEGECKSTYSTQIAEDNIRSGLINLDTVEAGWFTPEVTPEEVIFYAADNLNYTSKYLDKYWSGGYNDVADYPISNRTWAADESELPLQVFPVPLYNDRINQLAADYEGVKIERSHPDTDPVMKTKGIASQEVADELVKFMRINYEVGIDPFDKSVFYFGDADPQTIPGGGTEDGFSITDMSDFAEDFSYTSDIRSGIDGKHLGSLAWYPDELAAYNSEAELTRVKNAYNGIFTNGINDGNGSSTSLLAVYPNPASNDFKLNVDATNISVLNSLGQQVLSVRDYRAGTSISIETLTKGLYFVTDGVSSSKLIVE